VDWQFGRYRVEGLIARGGMGEVHRAYDTEHDRMVAIKLLGDHLASDDDFRRRFVREARAAARLREPHVIPIHAYGEVDGRLYLDMRLVEGNNLRARLAEGGPLDPATAVEVIGQIASALDAAHAEGLVHRDVKPSNVLLTAGGFAYLVDFGIARSVTGNADITGTGIPLGTVSYMAPERFEPDGQVGHQVDVYSLACLLYQCLTGVPPFTSDNPLALMYAHHNQPPPRPTESRPDLPPAFDQVVATGMAKRAEDRFASAGALAAAARQALRRPPTQPTAPMPAPDAPLRVAAPSRRGVWWLAGAAAAVVVAALVAAAVLNWPLDMGGGQPSSPTTTTDTRPSTPDLSLSVPLSTPACDGSYIVIVGSAVKPDQYRRTVQGILDGYPGTKYLHAPSTGCPSLRQQLDGADIYSVYYGPFVNKEAACDKRKSVGKDSFVRRLDDTSTPDRAVSCG
jgi:serine/threonine protein kinase